MHFKPLKKIVSSFTIIIFIATNSTYAAPESRSVFKNKKVDYQKLSDQTEDVVQKKKAILSGEDADQTASQQKEAQRILSSHLSDISLIHIPSEIGRIVEVYQGEGSRVKGEGEERLIVHIQDLHTNPEAEYNLAKILELLLNDYKMGLICSEGAVGGLDTKQIASFPDYSAREKVAKIFVNAGELTGEEYLAITKYPDIPIWGIENEDIYFKNIIDFNKIMKFNPQSQVFISQAKKALEELKNRLYSKELLELDQKDVDYRAQKIETDVYINYLTAYMAKLNIQASNYKNVALLVETMNKEKTIDQLKIMNEAQNLLLNLQSSLVVKSSLRNEADSLMAKAQLFKDQKISPFSFYSYLKDLANKHIKDEFSARYPNLNSFVDYLAKVNAVDSTGLFLELENLNFEIKEALSKTTEQKNLVKALRNINFLEGFFNLKVSNEELDYYLANKDSHKVAWFKTTITNITNKTNSTNLTNYIDYNPDLIDKHLDELEEFYKVVKERDVAMVDNSIAEIEKRNSKVSTLIAGGFHTKGIIRLLKERGYSYIVVSPYSKTDIDEANYHFLLTGQRKPITELLNQLDLKEIINRLAPTLRVVLGSNTGLIIDFNNKVAPVIARLAGLPVEKVVIEPWTNRITLALGLQRKAESWDGSLSDIEIKVPEAGILVERYKNGKEERYIRITEDKKPEEVTIDYFKGYTVAKVTVAGQIQVAQPTMRESLPKIEQPKGKVVDFTTQRRVATAIASNTGVEKAAVGAPQLASNETIKTMLDNPTGYNKTYINALKNLLPEAQELLDLLGKTKLEKELEADDISQDDLGEVNPVIFALGSPSPEAFKNAAKDWKQYKAWGFGQVPVITSTGRGRGYKNFVKMTLEFFEREDALNETNYAAQFKNRYGSEIDKALAKDMDALDSEYKGADSTSKGLLLTEAKVIAFIMERYGVSEDAIELEEESFHTTGNVDKSRVMLYKIAERYSDGKPLKIQVVAASFHRLRALLTTIREVKKERPEWQVFAKDSENAQLENMLEATFYDYVVQTIGDPSKPKEISEIERLTRTDFGPALTEESGEVKTKIETDWTPARIDKLRNTLLRDYQAALEGLSFMPTRDFKQGKDRDGRPLPVDMSLIRPTRNAEEARELLKQAKDKGITLSIEGHLRGVDGAGSSLDLPEFQLSLTKQSGRFPEEYPSTPTIASEFSVKIRFELADDPDAIEYIAPDYGIPDDNPYRIRGNVELDSYGRTTQKNGPAFIFRNLFGLSGIRIICEPISPMALAGGMESSNVFNVALIAAASMLSGAGFSYADIFNLAVKIENDQFAGLTGGQGHIGTMTGGAYQHIWLSGAKDANGELINPYSAFSIPLLTTEEQFKAVEDHMMLVQAGKEYVDGKAQVGRAASLTNNMWTDLLRDRDAIGLPLHEEKLGLTAQYTKALKEGDFATVVKAITRYVEIRDELCKRWLSLAIDAYNGVQDLPAYAANYASRVFDENNVDYNEYKLIRDMYFGTDREPALSNALKDATLYNLGAESLVKEAKEAGIALMGLGAGGPGANLIAISEKGNEYVREFLEKHGIRELTNEDEARAIIRGTGELKGYMPFKIGREGLQIKGFDKLPGVALPGKPEPLRLASNETETFQPPLEDLARKELTQGLKATDGDMGLEPAEIIAVAPTIPVDSKAILDTGEKGIRTAEVLLAAANRLGSNTNLTKEDIQKMVNGMAVPAEEVIGNKDRFATWVNGNPDIVVTIVAMDEAEYNSVNELHGYNNGQVIVITVEKDQVLREMFMADFTVYGKEELFGGFDFKVLSAESKGRYNRELERPRAAGV